MYDDIRVGYRERVRYAYSGRIYELLIITILLTHYYFQIQLQV